jgi:tetratricopeptide (TPR) repeat protein
LRRDRSSVSHRGSAGSCWFGGASRRNEAIINPTAYDDLVTGSAWLDQKNVPAFKMALAFFQKAASDDPDYADAYAKISETYINLASNVETLPAFHYARYAAEVALRLDPNLAVAHRTLGWLKLNEDHDLKGAQFEYMEALRIKSNDARTHHWYSQLLLAEKKPQEAIVQAEAGFKLAPADLGSNYNYAFILLRAGQPRMAIQVLEKALERVPRNEALLGHLGLAYEELREYGKAAEFLRRASDASELKYQYRASMVYPLAKSGNLTEARRIARELLSKKRNGEWIPSYNLAVMCVGLKDFDQAFYWLNQCEIDRSCSLLEMETNPILEELGSDSRFKAIERRLGGHASV